MGIKILFLVPHLSTGGMPQYVLWLIQNLLDNNQDIFIIEYSNISDHFIVQKSRIKNILKDNFITLNSEDDNIKKKELFLQIRKINPDIIHLQEFPEMWLPDFISKDLYCENRRYKIIETSHDSGFDPKSKRYMPDGFAFISKFHPDLYSHLGIPHQIIEYPVVIKNRPRREESLKSLNLDPSYKHILNVGLFTPRKNQAEIFEIAKRLVKYKIKFHFVGNQADNFKFYWESLMKNKPENCVIWGERSDVDSFYSSMDLFLFTSRGTNNDRETNPIVIKEALGWSLPTFIYNLSVYKGMYDDNECVRFLEEDIDRNCENILKELNFNNASLIKTSLFNVSFSLTERNETKVDFALLKDIKKDNYLVRVKDLKTQLPIYSDIFNLEKNINYWMATSAKKSHLSGIDFDVLDSSGTIVYQDKIDYGNNIDVFIDGKHYDVFSPKTGGWFSFYEIFICKEYENNDVFVEQGDVCLDLGSAFGFFSLYAISKGASRVYSVEPVSDSFNIMKKNVDRINNIIPFKCAIGKEDMVTKIFISDKYATNTIQKEFVNFYNSVKNDQYYSSFEEIHVLNINNFINENKIEKIDFMKIDVEASEYDIFEAFDENILRNRVRKIIGEYHLNIGERFQKNIKKKLEQCGFVCKFSPRQDLNHGTEEGIFWAWKKNI